MKFFIDTEFLENGRTIDLVSIGVVAEDGREYYAQSLEFDANQANLWVQENVFTRLERCSFGTSKADHIGMEFHEPCPWRTTAQIAEDLKEFVGDDKPEFWGEDCAFDYVVISWLFGGINGDVGGGWPANWPYYFNDLEQFANQGHLKLPEQTGVKHHALRDAKWIKRTYGWLIDQSPASIKIERERCAGVVDQFVKAAEEWRDKQSPETPAAGEGERLAARLLDLKEEVSHPGRKFWS